MTFWFKIIMFLSATWIQISLIPTLSMFNKYWWFLNFQKEFLNFSFCIRKLAVAFYMINEIQPKIKFQNIVQCPFNYRPENNTRVPTQWFHCDLMKYGASLNHNGIFRVPYKNASRMGLYNLCIVTTCSPQQHNFVHSRYWSYVHSRKYSEY